MTFLETKLDEISRSGSFAKDRIMLIKTSLDNSSHRLKNISNQSKSPYEEVKPIQKDVAEKKISFQGDLKTFYLRETRNNPDVFKVDYGLLALSNLCSDLKQGYIHKLTSIDQLKQLFSNRPFQEKDKITWVGTLPELRSFISAIHKSKLCFDIPEGDQWKIGSCCFLYKSRRKGKQIEKLKHSQISNPGPPKDLSGIINITNRFVTDFSRGSTKNVIK